MQTSGNDEVGNIKKENEILKHELKIVELKLNLKKDDRKTEPNLKAEKAYL